MDLLYYLHVLRHRWMLVALSVGLAVVCLWLASRAFGRENA